MGNHLDVYQKNQDFWNGDFLKRRWKLEFSFVKLEFRDCCFTPDCCLSNQNSSFGFTNLILEDALKFAALCNPKTWVLYLQTWFLTLLSVFATSWTDCQLSKVISPCFELRFGSFNSWWKALWVYFHMPLISAQSDL